MPNTAAAPAPIQSAYPRRRWLRTLALVALAYILIFGGIFLWWRQLGPRQLDQLIASCRAAGQPVLVDDFQPPSIPNDQNGYIAIRMALRTLSRPGPSRSAAASSPAFSSTDELIAPLRPLLNKTALDLIRTARSAPRVVNTRRLASPVAMMTRPATDLRAAAQLAADAAIEAHSEGRDAETVEYLLDELAVARIAAQSSSMTLEHMTAMSLISSTCRTIQDLTPTLEFATAPESQPAAGSPAQRAQVEALIRALLDESWLIESGRRALFMERLCLIDAYQSRLPTSTMVAFSSGVGAFSSAAFWQPIASFDIAYGMRMLNEMAAALAAPTWPDARGRIPRYAHRDRFAPGLVHLLSALLLPALDSTIESMFRVRMQMRLTALGLAVRQYEIDHGARPPELSALVPDYLLELPRDLMQANAGPPLYHPNAAPALLYSVGINGVDDDGRTTTGSTGPRDPDDILLYLNGDRPRSPRPRSARPDSASFDDEIP